MGLSGIILKSKREIAPFDTINDMKLAATNAGVLFDIVGKIHYTKNGDFRYVTSNLYVIEESSENKKAFLIYIYGEDDSKYDTRYDFLVKDGVLHQAIHIENFVSGEKFLFDFLYEYMKLNQKDIFWNEMDWYYDFQDIEIIHKQEFDPLWAYKKPDWK